MNQTYRLALIAMTTAGAALALTACERRTNAPATPAPKPAAAPANPIPPADPKPSSANVQPSGSGWGMPPPPPPVAAAEPPPAPEQPPLPEPYTGPDAPIAPDAKPVMRTTTPMGQVLEDYRTGTGAFALPKSTIWFKSVGRLQKDSKVFESNYEAGKITYGNLEQMLPALRDGIVGMRVGGQRRIYVPAMQGFGESGRKDAAGVVVIPGNADLVFDIELMGVASTIINVEPKPPSTPTPIRELVPTGG